MSVVVARVSALVVRVSVDVANVLVFVARVSFIVSKVLLLVATALVLAVSLLVALPSLPNASRSMLGSLMLPRLGFHEILTGGSGSEQALPGSCVMDTEGGIRAGGGLGGEAPLLGEWCPQEAASLDLMSR